MSKLVEKLRQTSQGSPQPFGFRGASTGAAQKRPPIVIIVALPEGDDVVAPEVKSSADAVLLTGSQGQEAEGLKEATWGASLSNGTEEEIAQLKSMACDFLAFNPAIAAGSLLGEEEMGKIIEVEPGIADGMLRALDKLPIDAVLLGGDSGLTVQRLMVCQHLANLVRKPLIARAPLDISRTTLEQLGEAGVTGIVVSVSAHDRKALSALRETVDSLPAVRKRRREKIDPVLPLPTRDAKEDEEDEDFDLKPAAIRQSKS